MVRNESRKIPKIMNKIEIHLYGVISHGLANAMTPRTYVRSLFIFFSLSSQFHVNIIKLIGASLMQLIPFFLKNRNDMNNAADCRFIQHCNTYCLPNALDLSFVLSFVFFCTCMRLVIFSTIG